jgi:hypothetical protein
MNALDKDQLEQLLTAVKLAKSLGFESLSSPVVPLLEAGTDVCLLLSSAFERGAKVQERLNPKVKFDYSKSDALGNPKSFKVFPPNKDFWAPQLAEFFRKLASIFVMIKQKAPKILDLISKIKEIFGLESAPEKTEAKTKKLATGAKRSLKEKRAAYFRRQRRKRLNGHITKK